MNRVSSFVTVCGLVLAACSAVIASENGAGVRLGGAGFRGMESRPVQPEEAAAIPEAPKPPGRFGAAGSELWTVGAGLAHNFDDAWDFNLRGGYSLFLIDDVEFGLDVNAWYFSQTGEDALGINPTINFRWHLLHDPEKPWTVFTEAGIGLLFATDQVPDGGTWIDFTPTAGVGYTRRIAADGTRLQVGARWHHISNARITGDARNPARDGLVLYSGIMIPF